jgi:D-methionine transport system substrate-binding protein
MQFNKDRKTRLSIVGPTLTFPMALYSKKVKSIDEAKKLPANSQVGIPNDPTQGARALQLLETAGLIKIKPGLGVSATVRDIAENPNQIRIVELEASQIYQHLDNLSFAAINTNFAISAGLVPTKDSIFIEASNSPWVNMLVSRTGDEENPRYKELLNIYHSPEIKAFIEKTFNGSVIASW